MKKDNWLFNKFVKLGICLVCAVAWVVGIGSNAINELNAASTFLNLIGFATLVVMVLGLILLARYCYRLFYRKG